MRVAVIGTGASALALAQRLEAETGDKELWLIDWDHLLGPGCPDVQRWHERIASAAHEDGIDIVVVLDRQPLADGIAETLDMANLPCFGPAQAAAAIAGSSALTEELVAEAGLPAAGCLEATGTSSAGIERAREHVVWAFCDGERARTWPALRRYPRAYDGDQGPDTAGMGAATLPSGSTVKEFAQDAADALITAMRRKGIEYRGLLALTIAATAAGPAISGLDTHWGDPDTQALLSVLDGPLLPLLADAAAGTYRDSAPIPVTGHHAVWVTLADHDYPAGPRPWNLEALPEDACHRYHAAEPLHVPERHFSVGATGPTPQAARQAAYARIGLLTSRFTGPVPLRWRTDIGTDNPPEAQT